MTFELWLLLFVGGARMGHFIAIGAMGLPLVVTKLEKLRYGYAASRLTAFFHSGDAPSAVPEPASVLFPVIAGISCVFRRRRCC